MRTAAKGMLPALFLAGACSGSTPTMVGKGPWLPLKVGNHWTYLVTEADGTFKSKVQGIDREELVGGTGPYKDKMAFHVLTGSPNSFGDESFQALEGTRVVRYRDVSIDGSTGIQNSEQYWDPPKLRLDEAPEHTSVDTSPVPVSDWVETYAEHSLDMAVLVDGGLAPDSGTLTDGGLALTQKQVMDLWSVVAENEPVTVPAGTFRALKLRRTQRDPKPITIKYFWFVRGVGKVKESGNYEVFNLDQTEELVRYTVIP